MQARSFWTSTLAAVCLFVSLPSQGQEGHPLVGSWHGDWGTDGAARNDLTVIMDWDGEQLTGLVNPVTDRTRLIDAGMDSSSWTVRFSVDLTDGSGNAMRCVADGKLDSLGSDRRTLSGTWTCGVIEGDFRLRRDRDY